MAGREVLEFVKVGLGGWRGNNLRLVLRFVLRIILKLILRRWRGIHVVSFIMLVSLRGREIKGN